MTVQFTTVYRPVPGGYVEELPGANPQGATLDEARANLEEEAVAIVLDRPRRQRPCGTLPAACR
jgi:hypothetical protein